MSVKTIKYFRTFFLIFTGIFLISVQSANAQSALDGFDPNADGQVNAVVVQPDGKILIGGAFTTVQGVTRNRVARLNIDGTLDMGFDPNVSGRVNAIAVQTDGKVLVTGVFDTVSGQTRNGIVRLDATTGAADSWNPNANVSESGSFPALVVESDGKILVGGDFTAIGGEMRKGLARLDPVSGLADSWNPNPSATQLISIAIQSDGKIVVSGEFLTIGGQPRNNIARLDPISGLADSWNPNAAGGVLSIAIQLDGKILAGGKFLSIDGQPRNRIARLDPISGLADSWDPNASSTIWAITVQSDGNILAGGQFSTIGGQTRSRIARLDSVTGLADSFDPNANSGVGVLSIAVQSDGKILAGGNFTTIGGGSRNRIARLERDGSLDQTLDLNTVGNFVTATAIQPDGKILIGGLFTSVLGTARNNIARLNADGTLDTAFDPNTNNAVFSIAVQSDGKILVGGGFSDLSPNGGGPVTRNRIARLNSDGTLEIAFDPNANGDVNSIAVHLDGKILLGGSFNSLSPNGGGAISRLGIARVNADGTLDAPFDPSANNTVISIAVQSDGKILVGGTFNALSPNDGLTVTRNFIARLNADGTLDSVFDPNANINVSSIAVQSDGKILLGGDFTSLSPNGGAAAARNRIARVNADGTVDTTFDPNADSGVSSIAVQSDGKILLGGSFNTLAPNGGANVTRNRIARMNVDGTLDTAFDPNANNFVYSIALQSDGKILVGGAFTSVGGQTRSLFARLINDTPALSTLTVTKTDLTLNRDGSAPQFNRVIFEQSLDNGATYTPLGTATNSFARSVKNDSGKKDFAPTAAGYTLTGLNLPSGQNILIRARGFYRAGYYNSSETTEDKVQIAFFLAPTAANVSVAGRVRTQNGSGIGNAFVIMTDLQGTRRSARTNMFGNYNFNDVEVGTTYVLQVSSKQYQFPQQVISVNDNITGLDFTANGFDRKVPFERKF